MQDQTTKAADKVKALAERIVRECKQLGFTVDDFQTLISELDSKLVWRQNAMLAELF